MVQSHRNMLTIADYIEISEGERFAPMNNHMLLIVIISIIFVVVVVLVVVDLVDVVDVLAWR